MSDHPGSWWCGITNQEPATVLTREVIIGNYQFLYVNTAKDEQLG